MSLIHYVRPFLDLGICKEYCMARKTTGNTTVNRRKKTEVPAPPANVQAAPALHEDVHQELRTEVREVRNELRNEVRKNGTPVNHVPVNLVSINLEEAIRRRAYELYLERRATAGSNSGDENQDWLIAEREIRSRQSGQERSA
jgi:hypothetical protein